MGSSALSQHDLMGDAEYGGYGHGRGYRYDRSYPHGYGYGYRRFPFFPFWLVFPLMFLLSRGASYSPAIFAIVPLVVLAVFALRFAVPALDGALQPRIRRSRSTVEQDPARLQRLELDLIDAHRQIRELEEKVAWQSKLLDVQTAAGQATGENEKAGR